MFDDHSAPGRLTYSAQIAVLGTFLCAAKRPGERPADQCSADQFDTGRPAQDDTLLSACSRSQVTA